MSSNLGFSHEENDRDKRVEGNLKLIRYMPYKNDKKTFIQPGLTAAKINSGLWTAKVVPNNATNADSSSAERSVVWNNFTK
jgi:hypothetical protein